MARNFLLSGPESANTVVFVGGTSNFIDASGKLTRNTARDGLHAYLEGERVFYYDPQIHPETHGRDYDYDVDGPAEQAARAKAQVLVYELGSAAQGAVTVSEIMDDAVAGKKFILWLNCLDEKGKPAFKPQGDMSVAAGTTAEAHLKEYVKNGTNLRKSVASFVKKYPNVTVCTSEAEVIDAIAARL